MSKMAEYVKSHLPGGSANQALTQMVQADNRLAKRESDHAGFLKKLCCCAGCSGALKMYRSKFGFKQCQEEVDMLTAGLTEHDRTQITENSLRIFRRRRICGESNYLIACDPIADGGTKLPTVSILRVSRTCSCQTAVRRICFDARHITQVEMSDAWETFELIVEIAILIFGLASWGYVYSAEPSSVREETMRNNVLVALAIGNICLLFVIILNFINTHFFRANQLVVDTCMPGRAMVTHKRFLSEVSYNTENSATNTAQQYIVTLPHMFAMDARKILQQWKQIADNMSSQLNLASNKPEPQVKTNADTHNFDVMMPSWARPVAEVAVPPPGAAVEVTEGDPTLLPPRHDYLHAAQASAGYPFSQNHQPGPHGSHHAGAGVAQRRREQSTLQPQAYMPPE